MEDKQPLKAGDRVRLLTNDCIDFITIGTVGTVVQKAPHQRFPPYMWLVKFDAGEGTWNIIDDTLERIDDTSLTNEFEAWYDECVSLD